MDPLPSASVRRARKLLQDHPEVRLAAVFGSAARGEARPASDLDLAVALRPGAPVATWGVLALDLGRVGLDIDLVDLAAAPPLLGFEIARAGQVLVEREPGAWTAWRVGAMNRWWDWAPLQRRLDARARARLVERVRDEG